MIEVTVVGGWGLVALDGEFDMANAVEIAAAVDHLVQQAVTEVTVDLSLVTFIDTSGINALLQSNQLVSAVNGRMVLVGAAPWVRRVFAATGVDDTLPVAAFPATAGRQDALFDAGGQQSIVSEDRDADDDLTRHLLELAELLLSDSTVTGDLRRVVHTAVSSIPGCVAASVSIMALGAGRSAAVTNHVAVEVDVAQYILDEGRCLHAAQTSSRVRLDVLDSDEGFMHFAPLALQSGIRAVLSVPVVLAQEAIGCLDLYSETKFDVLAETMGELMAAQTATALAKSDIVAAARHAALSAQRRSDDLVEIAVAQGVLASRHEVSVNQAGRLLGSAATANSETLVEVAQRVIRNLANPEP